MEEEVVEREARWKKLRTKCRFVYNFSYHSLKALRYPLLLSLYPVLMLYFFIDVAEHYPPGSRHGAPAGVEELFTLPLGFLFLVLLIWTIINKEGAQIEGNRIPARLFIGTPFRVALFTISFYFLFAVLSTCGVNWCLSFASFGVFSLQSILLGILFSVFHLVGDEPDIDSPSELEYRISNWRHFSQIFMTGSAAVGIGAFLQIYSNEFINARHLVLLFGPLSFGVVLCLFFIMQKIGELGSNFGSFKGDEK